MTVHAALRDVVAEQLDLLAAEEGIEVDVRQPDQDLADLGIDSLFVAELVVRVADSTGLYVTLVPGARLVTVENLLQSLHSEDL